MIFWCLLFLSAKKNFLVMLLPSLVRFSRIAQTATNRSLFSPHKFEQLDLHTDLQRSLIATNIRTMTEIQSQSFVSISKNLDTVLCSETGSGKTFAYLVPLFNRIMFKQDWDTANPSSSWRDVLGRARSPIVVLCPTVELCKQTLRVASTIDPQNRIIKQYLRTTDKDESDSSNVIVSPRIRWGAVDLVVTTPSKFVEDMTRFRENNLKPSCIVFDEADLLFHGPTQGHVLDIIGYLRPRIRAKMGRKNFHEPIADMTQFVFASATLPDIGQFSIGSMITQRFPTAELIRAGNFHSIPESVNLDWIEESQGDWQERCYMLTKVLSEELESSKRIMVFVNSSRNCELLFRFLADKKWPVLKYSKSCLEDGQVFSSSSSSSIQILVATDLAARGIDWVDVDTVVNFQMPRDVVTWIHRAGRCGRMGKQGKVITFHKQSEKEIVDAIKARVVPESSSISPNNLSTLFSRKRSLRRKIRLGKVS